MHLKRVCRPIPLGHGLSRNRLLVLQNTNTYIMNYDMREGTREMFTWCPEGGWESLQIDVGDPLLEK